MINELDICGICRRERGDGTHGTCSGHGAFNADPNGQRDDVLCCPSCRQTETKDGDKCAECAASEAEAMADAMGDR